jgi:hypothetical protein
MGSSSFVANNMLFRISRYRSQFLSIVWMSHLKINNFRFFFKQFKIWEIWYQIWVRPLFDSRKQYVVSN